MVYTPWCLQQAGPVLLGLGFLAPDPQSTLPKWAARDPKPSFCHLSLDSEVAQLPVKVMAKRQLPSDLVFLLQTRLHTKRTATDTELGTPLQLSFQKSVLKNSSVELPGKAEDAAKSSDHTGS